MFKVTIQPQWTLAEHENGRLLPRIVDLLLGVHESGTLAAACRRIGQSYRHAWGILQAGEAVFGAPLVAKSRGRGTVLTPLGEKLVWAHKRITARLEPLLDSLASELEVELEQALHHAHGILRLQASHGFAVEALRAALLAQQIPVDLRYRSSFDAVAALSQGVCDLAGFHVPIGEFERAALRRYRHALLPRRQRLIHVATRRQGLMVAPGNPHRIRGIGDLRKPKLQFVNRQPGSGTRMLIEFLLQKAGIDGHRIAGYDNGEFTHAAVAAYIASGMADVGFGVETPARRFGLDFIPLASERYFLLCDAQQLETAPLQRLLAVLRSPGFKTDVAALPGYDPLRCGVVQTLEEAFEALDLVDD